MVDTAWRQVTLGRTWMGGGKLLMDIWMIMRFGSDIFFKMIM